MLRFTLLASLALGTATANSTNRTATALQSPLQTRRFGVQVHCDGMTHCSNPPMPDICAAAQVTRNGAWWRYVEKVKGQYYFGNMEAWVAHANSCNSTRNGSVGINFVLNGGNHLYGGKDSDSPKTSAQVSGLTADQKKLVEQFKLMSPAEIAALPKEVQENVNLLRQRLGA